LGNGFDGDSCGAQRGEWARKKWEEGGKTETRPEVGLQKEKPTVTQIRRAYQSSNHLITPRAQVFFYLFHWIKGSPDNFSQGEFNGLTLWEQIDDGIPWTKTKKLFFLIHTVLVFAASYVTDYDLNYLAMNGPVYILLGIIPKIPEMHRVRVFGWNKTTGIDDVNEDALAYSATAAGSAATLGTKKSR